MNPRLDALLSRAADEQATPEEWRELESLMAADPTARRRYVQMMDLHAELRMRHATVAEPEAAPGQRKSRGAFSWLSWRPLTAAAAGLAIGLLSASVVFGFVGRQHSKSVPFLAEGFENTPAAPKRAFPLTANRWGGDLSAAVGAEGTVIPVEGSRMVRVMPPEKMKRRLSYAWRIVDLAEHPEVTGGGALRMEVRASFCASDAARPSHYQIRLAAFSQAPEGVRALWNNEPMLFDTVLQHVGRNVHTAPGTGWRTLQAVMQIPPGTRSIVIALGAGDEDAESSPQSAHYLDDVRANFLITQATAE
jgi:anti-sigma factor RsiW